MIRILIIFALVVFIIYMMQQRNLQSPATVSQMRIQCPPGTTLMRTALGFGPYQCLPIGSFS